MKQTAVEWLQQALEDTILTHEQIMQTIGLFEQAKDIDAERAYGIYEKWFWDNLPSKSSSEGKLSQKEFYNRYFKMKQTAVEWLIEKLNGQSTGLGMYGMNVRIDIPADIIQHAKEMEKEQTLKFGIKCQLDFIKSDGIRSVEDLYESTFNTNEK